MLIRYQQRSDDRSHLVERPRAHHPRSQGRSGIFTASSSPSSPTRTRITNRINAVWTVAAQGLSVSRSLNRHIPRPAPTCAIFRTAPRSIPAPSVSRRVVAPHRCDVSPTHPSHQEAFQNQRLEASARCHPALEQRSASFMTLKGIGLQSAWLFTSRVLRVASDPEPSPSVLRPSPGFTPHSLSEWS